jgi:hypothetical protein
VETCFLQKRRRRRQGLGVEENLPGPINSPHIFREPVTTETALTMKTRLPCMKPLELQTCMRADGATLCTTNGNHDDELLQPSNAKWDRLDAPSASWSRLVI